MMFFPRPGTGWNTGRVSTPPRIGLRDRQQVLRTLPKASIGAFKPLSKLVLRRPNPPKTESFSTAVGIALPLVLGACSAGPPALYATLPTAPPLAEVRNEAGLPALTEADLFGRWLIKSVSGEFPRGGGAEFRDQRIPHIVFRSGSYSGSTGCNNFGGYGVFDGRRYYASGAGQTEMGCGDLDAQERAIIGLMTASPLITRGEGGSLTLTASGTTMTLHRRSPLEGTPTRDVGLLAGTNWAIHSVDGTRLDPEARCMLRFEADHRILAGGCRKKDYRWSQRGSRMEALAPHSRRAPARRMVSKISDRCSIPAVRLKSISRAKVPEALTRGRTYPICWSSRRIEMVSLALIVTSLALAATAEANVTDFEVAADFAAAVSKGGGPHWRAPMPRFSLAGRRPQPLTRTEYLQLRASCKVNSLTRVGSQADISIDWRCGRYGEQRWNDTVTVEAGNVSSVLANVLVIQVPAPPAAASPAPRHPLQSLFSAEDYPAEAVRLREEGETGVRLTVNPQGRVTMCSVERSSRSAYLDSWTCRILRARARFRPAQDARGNAVEGTSTYTHVWKLSG
jgi:TonB family protein